MTAAEHASRRGERARDEPEHAASRCPASGQARWWALVPALTPVFLFANALAGRRLLAPGDGYSQFLPTHLLVARIWRAGDVPGWNPFAFSGSPLLAVNQAAVFYPPNLLFLLAPPAIANNATVVLSFAIAGGGAYALTRLMTGDGIAAAGAGLAFGLSGFMFAHIGHQNMIASIAWLPWVFFGYELLRQRFSVLRLAGTGGALALVLIAGHPQMFVLSLLALGVHATAITAFDLRSNRGRPLALLALVAGAGLALAAVQVLPTLSILSSTDRSMLDFETATSFSFPRSHLALLLFPYLFGNAVPLEPFATSYQGTWNLTELSGYAGAGALCLAAAGMGALRRDRRLVGLVAAASVALVVALGASTPVGRWVYELPVLGQFRSWGRYVVVFDLAVAVLAGHGIAMIRRATVVERRRAVRRAGAFAVLVVLAAVVVPGLSRVEPFVADDALLALALPAGFAVAAAVLCVLALRSPRVAPVVLCAVLATDAVVSFGWSYEWRADDPSVEEMAADVEPGAVPSWGPVPDSPGGIDRFVLATPDVFSIDGYGTVTSVSAIRSANGTEPLAPSQYLDTVGGMSYFGGVSRPDDFWRPGSDILDLLRISLVVAPEGSVPEAAARAMLGPGTLVPGTDIVRYERPPRIAEALLVGAVKRAPQDQAAAAVSGNEVFDPTSTASIEAACAACAGMTVPGSAGTASVRRPSTQAIEVDVNADRASLLVVSEAWFPGWKATVDGRATPVFRADGLVLGVPVEAGPHRVELRFEASGLGFGASITGLSALGLAVGAVVARRRRDPAPRRPPVTSSA